MNPGRHLLVVYARRTGASGFDVVKTVEIDIDAANTPPRDIVLDPLSERFMELQTPADHQIVGSSFVVSGWAVDLAAAAGSGVDMVHAWAYPESGGAPIWVGAATCGVEAGGVALSIGDRARMSGFSLSVTSLPPGTYRLVVSAHSTVTGIFDQSRSHVVTVTGAPR
jgi:hypothetical protein